MQALWLYGSHARGESRADSDIDLGVLAVGTLDPMRLARVACDLALFAGVPIDLVDLRSVSGLLRVEATHHGKRLAAPDPFAADLFATHALADYAAFAANRRIATESMQEKFHGR